MVKFRKAGPERRLRDRRGRDRREAAKLGLAVVEVDPTTRAPDRLRSLQGRSRRRAIGDYRLPEPADTEVLPAAMLGRLRSLPAGPRAISSIPTIR
jgi:hypothetical protein